MWAAIESPEGSGKFTDTQVPFKCSEDPGGGDDSGPVLGYIYSFGED